MICAFSRLAIGKVLKSKEGSEVVRAIEDGWIFTLGCPSSGFWTDNGKEFVNKDMDDLCDRWRIKINYGAPYSPWSNGTNKRNQASCDVVVEKLLLENKNMTLQEAVTKAQWTHNTNVSRHGFVPLQIMTGKSISFPGLESRVEETEVSEHIMEMLKARKALSEKEFKRRIKEAGKRVVSKYMDKVYEPGDKILF